MKPSSRLFRHLARLGAIGLLLGSTGCVVSQRAVQSQLPPDWLTALPKPGAPVDDIAGVFVDRGELLRARRVREVIKGSADFSTFVLPPTSVWRTPSTTVELRRVDSTHLEVILRTNDEISERHTLEIEPEPDTGMIALRHSPSGAASGNVPFIGYTAMTIRLWRGPDGRLYARDLRRGVGSMAVVPIMYATERWGRWEPATPEALQRQSAERNKPVAPRKPPGS